MLMNHGTKYTVRTRTTTKPYTSIRMYVRACNKRTPLYKTNMRKITGAIQILGRSRERRKARRTWSSRGEHRRWIRSRAKR